MAEKDNSKRLSRTEITRIIAKQTKIPQKNVDLVLNTYYFIVIEALKRNFNILMPQIGKFYMKLCHSRKEGYYINPITKEMEWHPQKPDYYKPEFKVSAKLIKDLRHYVGDIEFSDNMFDDEDYDEDGDFDEEIDG